MSHDSLPKREAPKPREVLAVQVARRVTLGLRRLAWLIEARGLANRSDGLGRLGRVDEGEGFRWARRFQGLSIKVRVLGGLAGPCPVEKSEGVLGLRAQGRPAHPLWRTLI